VDDKHNDRVLSIDIFREMGCLRASRIDLACR